MHQDVLGRGAARLYQRERLELWARPLADGTIAAGLFNRGLRPVKMTATWKELGISGRQPVRDLWLHRDLGTFDTAFAADVPAHALVIGRPADIIGYVCRCGQPMAYEQSRWRCRICDQWYDLPPLRSTHHD